MALKIIGALVVLLLIGAALVYLTNPFEKVREGRDQKRISDLKTLQKAIDYYISKNARNSSPLCNNCALGSDVFTYRPLNIDGSDTKSKESLLVNSHGWIPIDFSLNASLFETPFKLLPIDPYEETLEVRKKIPFIKDQIKPEEEEYIYTFSPGENGKYKLTAKMESEKGLKQAAEDGGTLADRYEIGELSFLP